MEFCTFTTQEEIEEAVAAVKQMEKDLNIKFTKKEFDDMVRTCLNPLLL